MRTRTGTCFLGLAAMTAMAVGQISVAEADSAAGTAVVVGQVASADEAFDQDCSGLDTIVQDSSGDGPSYVVPNDGVITSFSTQASSSDGGTMRLLIFRATGENQNYLLEGKSNTESLTASALNTFPTRIPVTAGSLLGMFVAGPSACYITEFGHGAYEYSYSYEGFDPDTEVKFHGDRPIASLALDISAVVESDADHDGYGDLSQDRCPTDATTHGTCPPSPLTAPDTTAPDTTFLKAPKQRVHKRAAVFRFRSSDQVQSFQCSIDNGAWKVCSSPVTKSFKPGRHTFAARAVDAAGNVDSTPAVVSWRFVPSRKSG